MNEIENYIKEVVSEGYFLEFVNDQWALVENFKPKKFDKIGEWLKKMENKNAFNTFADDVKAECRNTESSFWVSGFGFKPQAIYFVMELGQRKQRYFQLTLSSSRP